MLAQFAHLAKLPQLVQLAQLVQLTQFDKFFQGTDRNFAYKSNILVSSNFTIFRN